MQNGAVVAPAGGKTMEIAAVMMIAAVVLGILQQFDQPTW